MKTIAYLLGAAALVSVGVLTVYQVGTYESRVLREQVNQLEIERERLVRYAERLSAAQRVAQVDVVTQWTDEHGRPAAALLWQELGPSGVRGKPVAVEIVGEQVYIEALVLKFEHKHVGEGDPQRGVSLALFRRIFGDRQIPHEIVDLDRAARPPTLPGDVSAEAHSELWARFWDMVDHPETAREFGVRVAQIEAPAVRIRQGDVLEVSLDASGGLNLRKVATAPG